MLVHDKLDLVYSVTTRDARPELTGNNWTYGRGSFPTYVQALREARKWESADCVVTITEFAQRDNRILT